MSKSVLKRSLKSYAVGRNVSRKLVWDSDSEPDADATFRELHNLSGQNKSSPLRSKKSSDFDLIPGESSVKVKSNGLARSPVNKTRSLYQLDEVSKGGCCGPYGSANIDK